MQPKNYWLLLLEKKKVPHTCQASLSTDLYMEAGYNRASSKQLRVAENQVRSQLTVTRCASCCNISTYKRVSAHTRGAIELLGKTLKHAAGKTTAKEASGRRKGERHFTGRKVYKTKKNGSNAYGVLQSKATVTLCNRHDNPAKWQDYHHCLQTGKQKHKEIK